MNTATISARKPFGRVMQDVTQATSLDEALAIGGIDFTVARHDITSVALNNDGASIIRYPKHKGIVREDTGQALAVMSSTYGVVQNRDAFAPLDYLMREGIVSGFEQAGFLNHGGRCFLLANLHSDATIGGDPHVRRLLIATSHDGTGAVTARGWLHRVACWNQVPSMFNSRTHRGGGIVAKIRHTSRASSYLTAFRSGVLASISAIQDTENEITRLMDITVHEPEVEAFIRRMFPLKDESLRDKPNHLLSRGERTMLTRNKDQRSTLRQLINVSPTQDNVRGTAAALFHAAVEYSDYHAQIFSAERIVLGRDVAFKSKALSLAGAAAL